MMIVQKLFGVAAVIIFALAGPCQSQADTKELSLNEGKALRTFLVHSPKKLTAGSPVPLVIALHGGGTNGKTMEKFSGLSETADKYGFIVVYPNGSGRFKRVLTWNAGTCCSYAKNHKIDDVAFIRTLIDYMIRKYTIDPSRIYVCGISNGAMMAYRLAAETPDKLAAIAAVSGTPAVDLNGTRAAVPILHFHGTEDQFVPFEGGHGSRSLTDNLHKPVMETMKVWARINQTADNPTVENLPAQYADGTHVVRYTYKTKQDDQNIVLYKIIGGGHTWPGQPHLKRILGKTTTGISANDIMWDFFRAHPMQSSGHKK